MNVGVLKEIKNNENRVAITPSGVEMLISCGHQVYIEKSAGEGSGILDDHYRKAGANILSTNKDVAEISEMILKVKEPLPEEFELFRKEHILFTYLHLAAEHDVAKMLIEKGVVAIAYETIQTKDGSLPLLTPMSEVAGRMSVQIGGRYLEKVYGGKGIVLGGVTGVQPANVVIIGGGIVGINAAKIALGMGAQVTILEQSLDRMRYLNDVLHGNIRVIMSNNYNIEQAVGQADLLIGAVLIPGAKAPKLVTEGMIKQMKPGSVVIDVAIDQGGCVETIDRVTTHSNPIYIKHGIIHYAVANMPGAVPQTSTYALTNATINYAKIIADKGYRRAIKEHEDLALGVNVIGGKIVYRAVAEAHDLPYTTLDRIEI